MERKVVTVAGAWPAWPALGAPQEAEAPQVWAAKVAQVGLPELAAKVALAELAAKVALAELAAKVALAELAA
ncbi:MAG: hypothetical protein WBN14_20075, partial [Polyangiales bacterium]